MKLYKLFALFAIVMLSSCSTEEAEEFPNKRLSGTVQGTSFTAKGGKAFDDGENKISVHVTNVETLCKDFVGDYPVYISTTLSKNEGIYTTNVTFGKEGETPLNFLQGVVMVEKTTEQEITIRLKATSDAENTIEGRFVVPFCEE